LSWINAFVVSIENAILLFDYIAGDIAVQDLSESIGRVKYRKGEG